MQLTSVVTSILQWPLLYPSCYNKATLFGCRAFQHLLIMIYCDRAVIVTKLLLHASSPHHRWPTLVPTLQSIYSSSCMEKIYSGTERLKQVVLSLQSNSSVCPTIIGLQSETFRNASAPTDWNSWHYLSSEYRHRYTNK